MVEEGCAVFIFFWNPREVSEFLVRYSNCIFLMTKWHEKNGNLPSKHVLVMRCFNNERTHSDKYTATSSIKFRQMIWKTHTVEHPDSYDLKISILHDLTRTLLKLYTHTRTEKWIENYYRISLCTEIWVMFVYGSLLVFQSAAYK